MSIIQAKNFNLPWHQYDQYWIMAFPLMGSFSAACMTALQGGGMQAAGSGSIAIKTGAKWKDQWETIYSNLQKAGVVGEVEVAVVPGDALPAEVSDRRTAAGMQAIAESLWLGDALLEDRVLCYLQPVVSTKDKVFGYESFARVKMPDGSIVAGDKIVAASRMLNIEFMIDRMLHVQAIRTFVTSDFNGFLFVNLFPGFIHRPSVYLEGLGETAKQYGILAKHIVLDFTRAEAQREMSHMLNVCEFCRSKGYSIALDDIESLEGVKKLVPEVRPDFVKIDMQLVRQVEDPAKRAAIGQIVELVHAAGGAVIAEGVETEDAYTKLGQLNVDLYQGYLFSPPVPVETVLQKSAKTG